MIDIAEKEYQHLNKKKRLTLTADQFTEQHNLSVAAACNLFGYTRQVYHRGLKAEKAKQKRAEKVLQLVREKRMIMPRLGTKKLYHLLTTTAQNPWSRERQTLCHIKSKSHVDISQKKIPCYHKFLPLLFQAQKHG